MSDKKHEIVANAQTLPTSAVLHPAVEKMLETNPTPEALEKILALQRDWEAGQAKKAYTRALINLRRDLPTWIKRDKVVDFTGSKGRVRYTHTSLAAAMDAVDPALIAHGFSISWTPSNADGGKVQVTANLTHRDGHSESATLAAPPDTGGLKSAPQAIASTVTLLQRYTVLALLGIATADMNESGPSDKSAKNEGEQIDSAHNRKAMAELAKRGKTKKEVEDYVGKPITKWMSKDIQRLREWIKPKKEEPREEEAQNPEKNNLFDR